ncbi:hypothetical protein LRS06_13265 [Hymenobacter sp. J193]|uniref:hypothetical protein n=1 Tax=Hymenobacter sp. J193 TaxID=2898429 RepID=UPI0021519D3A|nr:hypothetical protein [Hymenobacter sp. J193]MCR5888719.1 hypothetical protein [Hymenobacter sp. J193]
MKLRFPTYWLGLGLLLPGCAYENAEELLPQPACDVSAVTYSQVIQPLLQQRCYPCHSTGRAQGNTVLDNLAAVQQHAGRGALLGVLTPGSGYPAMPQGGPALDECEVATIRAWVAAGSPDN